MSTQNPFAYRSNFFSLEFSSDMEPTMRRRSILKFKKYIFMFFAVLLAVIWVNHYTQGKNPKKVPVEKVEHESHEEIEHTPRAESPQEKRIRILRERLLRDDEDTEETSTAVSYEYEQEYDELESLSAIQRSLRKRKPPTRFFVMSSKCKMPEPDPFSSNAEAIPKPVKLQKCSSDGPVFALKFDHLLQRYRLQVDTTMLAELEPNLRKYWCTYREVANDTKTPWKSFQDEAVIEWISKGIVAECHGALRGAGTIQEDAFPLVQVPYRRVREESDPLKRRPSVLLLGLDSISRMNFNRSMPKTAEVVNQEGWFEMKGYTKVGDNAFSNLCAILGGAKSDTTCLQRFPALWKAYKDAGYTTAFGADSAEFPVPQGFHTDYQLRTLLDDIGQSMKTVTRFGLKYCLGRRQSSSYLYDFCMQVAQRLIEELDQPTFGVFWSSTMTSDFLHGPTSLDGRLVEYLELMREHHVFERAIVILVSDQGQMSGDLLDRADGFLEERLPMLHIYLPPWFRDAYPSFASNLLNNRNRLTSPFDLYNTLRHILNLKASAPKELAPLMNCRSSQSLLHFVPFDRSCEEACIGLHYCVCNEFKLMRNSIETYHLAKTFVSYINLWMLRHRYNLVCQQLLLSAVDYIEGRLDMVDNVNKVPFRGGIKVFRLRVQTEPEGGVLESTLRYNLELNKLVEINVKDISSLSGHTRSDCVNDTTAKKFCVCYPEIKDESMEYWANYTLK